MVQPSVSRRMRISVNFISASVKRVSAAKNVGNELKYGVSTSASPFKGGSDELKGS
jgi:hypothetical protein